MASRKKKNQARRPATDRTQLAGHRRCGLCGKTSKLTRTECCRNWICDDEANYRLFSYACNSCSRNHRRYTLCSSHYEEGHEGDWRTCSKCRENFETEMYVWYGTNEHNFEKLENPPAYEPTHCSKCRRVIKMGEEGFGFHAGKYVCETCSAKEFGSLLA